MMRPPETGGGSASSFDELDDAEIEPKRGTPEPILPTHEGGAGFPGTEDDNLPQRLGERLENGSSSSMTTGEPDVLPDVEVPDTTM